MVTIKQLSFCLIPEVPPKVKLSSHHRSKTGGMKDRAFIHIIMNRSIIKININLYRKPTWALEPDGLHNPFVIREPHDCGLWRQLIQTLLFYRCETEDLEGEVTSCHKAC